jgi:hypothetical protein
MEKTRAETRWTDTISWSQQKNADSFRQGPVRRERQIPVSAAGDWNIRPVLIFDRPEHAVILHQEENVAPTNVQTISAGSDRFEGVEVEVERNNGIVVHVAPDLSTATFTSIRCQW